MYLFFVINKNTHDSSKPNSTTPWKINARSMQWTVLRQANLEDRFDPDNFRSNFRDSSLGVKTRRIVRVCDLTRNFDNIACNEYCLPPMLFSKWCLPLSFPWVLFTDNVFLESNVHQQNFPRVSFFIELFPVSIIVHCYFIFASIVYH